ncbi:hypothetical protein V4C53_15535 [Paraburkholderia azotifigens]|uniref:hypothetical protein n=1 Tax=Paraburkholderia azotifigens TaxID=2057004 RepID=UPI003178B676
MISNKIINVVVLLLLLSFRSPAICGEVSIYDETSVVTLKDGGEIYGFYSAHNERFFCNFFFMSVDKVRARPNGLIPMETFNLDYHKRQFNYTQRDADSSIKGSLSMNGDKLNIRTNARRPGCDSAAGGLFSEGGLPYTEKMKVPGLGIAVATKKTAVYDVAGRSGKHGYLMAGDVVVVLRRTNRYSYIRYFNPDILVEDDDKRKIVTGWILSADLSNPFPPAAKH